VLYNKTNDNFKKGQMNICMEEWIVFFVFREGKMKNIIFRIGSKEGIDRKKIKR
jgi:hypothetical protein